MESTSQIYKSFEDSRKDLLDFTGRNRLTNYRRPTEKRGGIAIVDADPADIYRALVEEAKSMSFQATTEYIDGRPMLLLPGNSNEKVHPEQPIPISTRTKVSKLQTTLPKDNLDRRLKRSHTKARTFIEEQGVNALFLAIGLLVWYEAEASQEKREAPLILIPVELVRDNVRSRYKLRYTGEDVGFNISLQERLQREFAITLPTWPEDQELDIDAYMKSVSQSVATKPRWSLATDALFVDFYRFSKLHMYQDLDTKRWDTKVDVDKHSVLSKLLGSSSFLQDTLATQENGLDYDSSSGFDKNGTTRDSVAHAVMDADSSQERAINAAINGKNLIIQGPPGTGKSQTITNIIAESICQGKSVLFVAEKMAALEVVKRRLDSLGLGDACLALHSDKTKKKAFLDELERTLNLGEPLLNNHAHTVQALKQERDHLDQYCQDVNAEITGIGLSPHKAYGEYLKAERKLSDTSAPQLSIPECEAWPETDFHSRLETVSRFQALLKSMGRPKEHPFWGSTCQLFLPAHQQVLRNACSAAESSIADLRTATEQVAGLFGIDIGGDRDYANHCLALVDLALDSPTIKGLAIVQTQWSSQLPTIQTLVDMGIEWEENRTTYCAYLVPEAVQEDMASVRKALMAHGGKFSRFWSWDYRRSIKLLRSISHQELPSDTTEQLPLVDAVLNVQRLGPQLEMNYPLFQQLFDGYWNELNPTWSRLQSITQWVNKALNTSLPQTFLERLFTFVSTEQDKAPLAELRMELQKGLAAQQNTLTVVKEQIELDEAIRFGETAGARKNLETLPFAEQIQLLHQWALSAGRLQEIASFNALANELRVHNLEAVIPIAEEWPYAPSRLVELVCKSRYANLIERAMRERSSLANFSGATHQHRINRFRKLDSELLTARRTAVLHSHWERLPRYHAGEVALLHEQFNRKRGHKSIRTLMEQAGRAIQASKPVFMMSPFSIAMFLPPGSVEFDLVVFDEASQVRPVDALGAILRSKQTVVVGDDKQMPPTNFFDKVLDEEDNENVVADTESILGLFKAKAAPQEMLEWHYRSRHESLIAVSNHEFYENRLIVFPSPDKERKNLGLVFHHLPHTHYKRRTGGSTDGGYNQEEAQSVAKAVMSHARRSPDKSLLVAAFNQKQREVIENLVDKERINDDSGEPFFTGHPTEPFAVKNLENVQGDERDVILISVGFGRDQDNKLSMNFGPLNRNGGERRLNVLITRARERCEIFSNISANDIDLSRTSARGVKALKRFLKYAETGIMDLPEATGGEADSPFEQAVVEALQDEGYRVDMQVGTGGYRIDIGIIDDEQPGRYILGVECDGATYHSAKSARDRDRLRQEVLEAMGWQIHRIWSTDWFRNPQREIQRVNESVDIARAKLAIADRTAASDLPAQATNEAQQPSEDFASQIAEAPTEAVVERIESVPAVHHLPKYQVAEPTLIINGDNYGTISASLLAEELANVVEIEAPIHIEQLFQRVSTRVSKNIRERLSLILDGMLHQGTVVKDGDYLILPHHQTIEVRDRSDIPGNVKKIEHIHPEELEQAIMQLLSKAYSVSKSDLGREALKLLGYMRVTEKMASIIGAIIEKMLAQDTLRLQGKNVVQGKVE